MPCWKPGVPSLTNVIGAAWAYSKRTFQLRMASKRARLGKRARPSIVLGPVASVPLPHWAMSRWWMPQQEIMPSEKLRDVLVVVAAEFLRRGRASCGAGPTQRSQST